MVSLDVKHRVYLLTYIFQREAVNLLNINTDLHAEVSVLPGVWVTELFTNQHHDTR